MERPRHQQKGYSDVAPLGWGLHSLSGGVGWGQLFKELRAEAWFVGRSQTFLPSIPQARQGDQSSSILFAAQ